MMETMNSSQRFNIEIYIVEMGKRVKVYIDTYIFIYFFFFVGRASFLVFLVGVSNVSDCAQKVFCSKIFFYPSPKHFTLIWPMKITIKLNNSYVHSSGSPPTLCIFMHNSYQLLLELMKQLMRN